MDTALNVSGIPPKVLNKVQAYLNQASDLLEPYLKTLTVNERKLLPKMGSKSLNFVEKAYQFAKENPKIRPGFMDMKTFTSDFSNVHEIWKFYNSVRQLEESLKDTELFAGSKSFDMALMLYHALRDAVKQDVPGAKIMYDELKSRFPGHRRRAVPAPTNI